MAPQIEDEPLKNNACQGHSPLIASLPNSMYDPADVDLGKAVDTPHSDKSYYEPLYFL